MESMIYGPESTKVETVCHPTSCEADALVAADGSLRSREGTIYVMNDKPGLGVKKKRKELRVQEILSAWYGDPAFPWVETVTDEDGTWIKVGRNTTDEMMSRVKNGVLIVPLPFDEQLGDPCPGTEKTLMINYTDIQGTEQTCVWDDGSIYSVSFLQAIRATYSPYVSRLHPQATCALSPSRLNVLAM